MNLWKLCMHSIIYCLHHAKYVTNCKKIVGKLWEILGEALKRDAHLWIILCIFNCGHCKSRFPSITVHEGVVLNLQYLFCGCTKLFQHFKLMLKKTETSGASIVTEMSAGISNLLYARNKTWLVHDWALKGSLMLQIKHRNRERERERERER